MCQQQGPARASDLRADAWVQLTSGFGCPVAEEPGLAALDNLETRVLWGLRQVLGLGSQECVEVLQLRDLENRQCYGQVQLVKPDGKGEAKVTPSCPQAPEPGGKVRLSRMRIKGEP